MLTIVAGFPEDAAVTLRVVVERERALSAEARAAAARMAAAAAAPVEAPHDSVEELRKKEATLLNIRKRVLMKMGVE